MKRRCMAVMLTAALLFCGSMPALAAETEESVLDNEAEKNVQEETDMFETHVEAEIEMVAEEAAECLETNADDEESTEEPVEQAENMGTSDAFYEVDENGLEWRLEEGVLTISGNGKIEKNSLLTQEQRQTVTSIVIGEGVLEIGRASFYGYASLNEVSIANSVTVIGRSAFLSCRALSVVFLPGGVVEIGDYAFAWCKSLTELMIPNSVTRIGIGAFKWSGIETVSIPKSVTEIGDEAFAECNNLINISVPNGMTKISSRSFYNCINLKETVIPKSVTEIAYGAFEGCKRLPEVMIPDNVKSIGCAAFSNCTRLQSVKFGGDIPEINGEDIGVFSDRGVEPFQGVTATVFYPAGNQTYTEENKASYGTGLIWEAWETQEMSFADVTENDWYYDAADFVFSRGIMTGMNDKEFGPGVELSRAQFATMLYRMAGEPDVLFDSGTFPDVTDGKFYTYPAIWAKSAGVITGYEDGTFGPSDWITREQMAVMMYRYAKKLGLDVSAGGDMSVFPDAAYVSPFAEEAVKWAVGEGLIRGDGGIINPLGVAERAQCAVIIMRFMESYGL